MKQIKNVIKKRLKIIVNEKSDLFCDKFLVYFVELFILFIFFSTKFVHKIQKYIYLIIIPIQMHYKWKI